MSSINLTSPPTHSQCTIQQLIPRLIGLLRILTHPYATILIIPLLIYNIFIYIYLGILEQGIDFYRGFGLQYSLFYSAIAVGYWSIWIQSQQLTNSSIIITNELLNDDSFTKPPCDCPSLLWCLTHSTHFRLIESNLKYLYLQNLETHDGYFRFKNYCAWWKTRIGLIFGIWSTVITSHIVIKSLPQSILNLPQSFDSRPIVFYGFLNLFSQYLAMIIIVTGGITMLIGFYQLRFIILEYAKKMRTRFMKSSRTSNPSIIKEMRKEYLEIQQRCLAVSFVWSTPVLLVLFSTTQIIISNIVLIHYSMIKCGKTPHTCGWIFIYPIVGLLGSLTVVGILLRNIAKVNFAAEILKNIFVYSQNGDTSTHDYEEIGGRQKWLDYLDSNPLYFTIGGISITPDLVVKSSYTIATAIASLIMADLFG